MTATTSTRLTCDVVTRQDHGFTVICGYQYDDDGTASRVRGTAQAEGWTTAYADHGIEDRCPLHSPPTRPAPNLKTPVYRSPA